MRIWTPPDAPAGSVAAAPVAVEWGGRIGHPSSYGLLGGQLIDGQTQILVPEDGGPFHGALAAWSERVVFGLAAEYRSAITSEAPVGLALTVAAHGDMSSSRMVFRWLTCFLVDLLETGVPENSENTWLRFDAATVRAGRLTNR